MIMYLAIGIPPVGNRVTGQFTSMVGGANLDVAYIIPNIVKSVRNSNSSSKGWPIMVKHLNGFLGVQLSLSLSLPNQFFFLVSILMTLEMSLLDGFIHR
jgi:hypothetical protein